MRGRLGDKARLNHILDAIGEIESYILDVDFNAFQRNSMMRFACIKQLEIIGEASDHISDDVKSENIEIDWRQIKGMRNIFVHEYFGIDTRLVWDIIIYDLPDLKVKLRAVMDSL